VWFLLADETFWVASSTANVKIRNIRHDPRVSLAIDGTGDRPHVAQGLALLHESPTAVPQIVALFAEKYDSWDLGDEGQDGPRVLIEVPVARWLLAID
jgi:general stress protein 26